MVNIAIHFVLPLLFLVAPVSIVMHEIGHLLGAKIVKADYLNLSIGQGKRLFSFSGETFIITVHALYFLGGETKSKRKQPYKPLDILLITAGGPIVNLLLVFVFYVIYSVYPFKYILLLILFNLWLGLGNLIPFKIRGKCSDGYIIFKAILECDKIK